MTKIPSAASCIHTGNGLTNPSSIDVPNGRVVTSPPATEKIGAMGREIESRKGIHREVDSYMYLQIPTYIKPFVPPTVRTPYVFSKHFFPFFLRNWTS
jgi:hypothetical protein